MALRVSTTSGRSATSIMGGPSREMRVAMYPRTVADRSLRNRDESPFVMVTRWDRTRSSRKKRTMPAVTLPDRMAGNVSDMPQHNPRPRRVALTNRSAMP